MRVLHAYRTYFPDTQGGVEETIRQICLNTRRHGVESRVLCLSPGAAPAVLEREEAEVYRVPKHAEVASCTMSLAAPAAMRRLARWADVVHYHFPWPFADMLHFGVGVRRPAVLTYHSDIVRQRLLEPVYRPLMNRFLGAMGRIVCTSPNYLASSPVLPRFGHKVDVVPIGLTPNSYPDVSDEQLEASRAEFGTGFFLYVGVLRYYKSVHVLLDAMQGAPFRAVVAGEGPEGPALRRQAARLGLDNVTFAGRVSDETKVALLRLCRGLGIPIRHALGSLRRDTARSRHARAADDLDGTGHRHELREPARQDGPGGGPERPLCLARRYEPAERRCLARRSDGKSGLSPL